MPLIKGKSPKSVSRWSTDSMTAETGEPLYVYGAEACQCRETVAKWMIREGFSTGHGDSLEDLLGELSWQIKQEAEMLDWLSHNDVIQQEVGSYGWRLPERSFRQAIRAAIKAGKQKKHAVGEGQR
jgi:hypothetical protein